MGAQTRRGAVTIRWDLAHLNFDVAADNAMLDLYDRFAVVLNDALELSIRGGFRAVGNGRTSDTGYGYLRLGVDGKF